MRKTKGSKVERPYKRTVSPSQVAEDVQKATAKFITTAPPDSNKYEMILVAARRAKDLTAGAPPKIVGTHRPLVTALLEIEAGEIGWDYI
jgi:DNA-directed RNA polymerase omega subunit